MARVTIERASQEVEWKEFSGPKHTAGRRRLLITTDNFLPRWDGISRFLAEIIPRLKESYDITIVAPDYGHVSIDGVTIERIPLRKRRYGDYVPARFAYRRIKRLVRQHDLVFNQALGPIGMCAILAARRARRPIASYIHSIEWELLPRALELGPLHGAFLPVSKALVKYFYNRCTVLLFPSENIAELFSWQRIRTPKRIAHLGVDTSKFTPGERSKARESLNLPPDAFIIGYHGRIAYEKNLLVLLRAFRRLQVPRKHLLLVGDGVPALKSRLLRGGGVTVAGSTNHVTPWLHAMDVYVQPSHTETTSLSVLEAMACGLPVVSSKVGFIKYYIMNNENGLFFDNNSAYDLSVKLQQLARDQMLRTTLSVNARRMVVERFNWERTTKDIKEILDGI